MLHPHPHGDRLEFDGDALSVQHFKDVAGRVTRGEDHLVRIQPFAVRRLDATNRAIGDEQFGHPGVEKNLSALGQDPLTHCFDDRRQFVRADMRMRIDQDLPRGAEADQGLQHRS